LALTPALLRADLDRRKGGQPGTTARAEPDEPELLSGVYRGRTTGAPIAIVIRNHHARSRDYAPLRDKPRPGHADLTGHIKSRGYADPRGGGHFSGRITAPLVAAGAIARALLRPVQLASRLLEAGGRQDAVAAAQEAGAAGDTIGGLVECRVTGLAAGIGEPFFDSLESQLAHAIFAIPGIKGVEFGAGFAAAQMVGSELNDPILDVRGRTETNHAGGINGGLSNGNDILFRVAVRPAASISLPQRTVDLGTGSPVEIAITGRHDPCIALRVPVVVEAVTAIVIADLSLRAHALSTFGGARGDGQPPAS